MSVGDLDVAERAPFDRGRLGVAHDRAVLVDPRRHRDVDEAEQLAGHVAGVDQARVGRGGGVDPLVACARAHVERNRHDGQPLRLEFCVQRLPPGQARAAASIAGPGDEQHLAAVQRRQPERFAVAVDQRRGRRATAVLSTWPVVVPGRAPRRRASASCTSGIPSRSAASADVDRAVGAGDAGRRHADLAAAQALRLRGPSGRFGEARRP